MTDDELLSRLYRAERDYDERMVQMGQPRIGLYALGVMICVTFVIFFPTAWVAVGTIIALVAIGVVAFVDLDRQAEKEIRAAYQRNGLSLDSEC